MAVHEAHGRCESCGYPAHRYPFGWQHVGTGMFSCALLVPEATCCDGHALETTCTVCGETLPRDAHHTVATCPGFRVSVR